MIPSIKIPQPLIDIMKAEHERERIQFMEYQEKLLEEFRIKPAPKRLFNSTPSNSDNIFYKMQQESQ